MIGLRILVIGGAAQDLQEIQSFADANDHFTQISVGADLHLILSKSWDGVILRCISMGSEEKRDEVKALLQASSIPAAVWAENFNEERAALWFNAGAERLFTRKTMELQITGFLNILRKRKSIQLQYQDEMPVTPMADALLDTMAAIVLGVDEKGRIFYMNRACEEITGYQLEEVYHSSFLPFVHPEDREITAQLFENINRDPTKAGFTNRWISRDGKDHWIEWSYTTLKDNKNRISVIVGSGTDITEEHKKALELSETEALFEDAFYCSPVALGIINGTSLKMVMINPAGEDLLGLPREKIIGSTIDELGLPLSIKSGQDILNNAFHSGRLINQEYKLKNGTGDIRTVLFSFDKVFMKGEQCILCSGVDITDRKTAEEAIQKLNDGLEQRVKQRTALLADANAALEIEISRRKVIEEEQKKLTDILEETPDIVAFCDSDGTLKFINRAGWEFFGETRTRINRTNVMDWFKGEEYRDLWRELRHYLIEKGSWRGETKVVNRNGETIPLSLVILAHKSENGNIHYISTIARDISKMKETYQLLEESEQRFRSLAEAAKDFIFTVDCDGIVQFVNSVAAHAHFLSPDQIVHQPIEKLFTNAIESGFKQKLSDIFQSGRPLYLEDQIHFPAYGTIWVGTWLVPLLNPQEQVYLVTGVARDITQLKTAQMELERSFQQEKELNELRANFISMASHEFRTPISVVLSSAELLKYYGENWPSLKRQEHYQRINDASQRLNGILQDLLTIGRAQSSQDPLLPESFGMKEFCDRLINEIIQTDHLGHEIRLQISAEDDLVCLDKRLLHQVLENLLSNAVKYSPAGSQIDLIIKMNNGNVNITIADKGRGIPEKDQKRLFQAFYRGSNIENIPGTGLGLTIVRFYVERLGGKIEYTSQEGIGTTFTITLPNRSPKPDNDPMILEVGSVQDSGH